MIVATAGHVDHGKSSLVKRLTGVDMDRLTEEKARGLTIDLGFAYASMGSSGVVGFVDVPGHERFIANMLAGVASIDYSLLVVAADDGWMPQTEEHVSILDLLQIPCCAIVISKVDRVVPQRVQQVGDEILGRAKESSLAGAAIFPVSTVTGQGIEELRSHLDTLAAKHVPSGRDGNFRLAVDRRFTLHGVGLIVTGAAISGSVAAGDQLVVSPGGFNVRVRSIHAQNRPARTGHAGERLALNLVGSALRSGGIVRGDWIVAPPAHAPTSRLDARLRVLSSGEKPLGRESPVHFHIGSADIPARVTVLEGINIGPGEDGLVQIALSRPAAAARGDRFIVRDQSAQRTIGGGSVINPYGSIRGRMRSANISLLTALEHDTPGAILGAVLGEIRTGIDLLWLARLMNLTPAKAEALWAEAELVKVGNTPHVFGLSRSYWDSLRTEIEGIVQTWSSAHAESPGAPFKEVMRAVAQWHPAPVIEWAVTSLVSSGRLRDSGRVYFHSSYQTQAGAKDALAGRILQAVKASGVPPATVNELAERLGIAPSAVLSSLEWAARRGIVRKVSATRFFLAATVAHLAQRAEQLSAQRKDGLFRVTDFRDSTGVGRNPSIELLEYFDKCGFTCRTGHDRRVVRSAVKMFGGY